jgi:hypothetical protein
MVVTYVPGGHCGFSATSTGGPIGVAVAKLMLRAVVRRVRAEEYMVKAKARLSLGVLEEFR